MTREEAKKELSKLIFELGFEDNVDDKVYALNMAIQALENRISIKQIRAEIENEADEYDAYVNADVARGLYKAGEIIDKHMK